jgi:outer membrane protein assembly factor BamD (BamD/ComL family)
MSISAILSGSLNSLDTTSVQSKFQQFHQIQQEFHQLGQDLQSGNLSAAQSDFATLQQLQPQSGTTSSAPDGNPITQAFNQLAQDLQGGNLPAAQQDFATIQQDFQNRAAQTQQASQAQTLQSNLDQAQQTFQQLGQDLQAGNLSAAQSDFGTLQQLKQQSSAISAPQSNDPIAQGFRQLAKDLQAGNLSGAQQDFANIEQGLQNQAAQVQQNLQSQVAKGPHHHPGGVDAAAETLVELGQELQSGNLGGAQQAYSVLQQDFLLFQSNGAGASSSPAGSSGTSINA